MNKIDIIKTLLIDESNSLDNNSFLKVGKSYLIRTITMIYTGRIKAINKEEILLEDAAWIAETKRWHDTLKQNDYNEVEPYIKDVVLFKSGILDVTEIDKLPKEQK